jgi:hypothetical protein
MGIYAGIGVSQAIFNFSMGAMFALLTYYASQRLHKVSYTNNFTVRIRFISHVGGHRACDARTNVILCDNRGVFGLTYL